MSSKELKAASMACKIAAEIAKRRLGKGEYVDLGILLAGFTDKQLDEFIQIMRELETDFDGLIPTHDCLVREDTKAHEHPIISEPSMVNKPSDPDPGWTHDTGAMMMQDHPPIMGRSPAVEKLLELARNDGVKPLELIEVINGLRLFPRGVEHQIDALPEPKVDTLIKNWETVLRQVNRIRKEKNA